MRIVHHRPRPPLDRLVRLWACDAPQLADGFELSLPVGTVSIFVNLAEPELRWHGLDGRRHATTGGAAVASARAFPYLIDAGVRREVLGATFFAGAARPFFAAPVDALGGGAHVALGDVWGRAGELVRERVLAETGAASRLELLERMLREQLVRAPVVDPDIARAAAGLSRGERVAAVRAATGASATRFIRSFAAHVGLTPKRYQRVQRLEQTVRALGRPHRDLATVAATCGYFDQSHLVHELRGMVGATPSALLAGEGPPIHVRVV